jgi:hypothetical protein
MATAADGNASASQARALSAQSTHSLVSTAMTVAFGTSSRGLQAVST